MAKPTLAIQEPGQPPRAKEVRDRTVLIGRAPDNNVVLTDDSVGDHHAKLVFTDEGATLEHLDASAETKLGGERVPLYYTQHVANDARVQIGRVVIIVSFPGRREVAPDPATLDRVLLKPLQAYMEQVVPGTVVARTVEVRNATQAEDTYALSVSGVPRDWVDWAPTELTLAKGAAEKVTITFRPPPAPTTLAGTFPYTVTAISTREPKRRADMDDYLEIAARDDVQIGFRPTRVDQRFTVEVANRGNEARILDIVVEHEGSSAVSYWVEPPTLRLAPGDKRQVQVRAEVLNPPLVRGAEDQAFRVSARQHSGGAGLGNARPGGRLVVKAQPAGQLIVRPLVPLWLMACAAVAMLAAILLWVFG